MCANVMKSAMVSDMCVCKRAKDCDFKNTYKDVYICIHINTYVALCCAVLRGDAGERSYTAVCGGVWQYLAVSCSVL